MELRLLTTEAERRAFEKGLEEARATNGAGFREAKVSRAGEIHLAFGRLYALFDENGPEPDQMLAGIIIHDLASFSLSHCVPDMRHLPPETVFEVGELWSRAKGAGLLIRAGMVIVLGLSQAQAVVGYAIAKPWDLTKPYSRDFFAFVGEPIEWPWVETLEGEKIWVQPVVSEGARLRRMLGSVWSAGFQSLDRHRVVRFANPYPVHPRISKEPVAVANDHGQETNGSALA